MIRLLACLAAIGLVSGLAHAQPRPRLEQNVAKQRAALDHWTGCIAAEEEQRVRAVLKLDYRDDGYKSELADLSRTRVSRECFDSIPRRYRKMRLTGLPFAGGLAEKIIEMDEEPLLARLSKAVLYPEIEAFSYTDRVATCTVRGAPHLVAALLKTGYETESELAALAQLAPTVGYCSQGGARIEASPLAMRSMLATASYRLLAAEPPGREEAFVGCLADKDPVRIAAIRDANSQEAFVAAMREGTKKCDADIDRFSMGKLFKALNVHGKDSPERAE